MSEGVHQGFLDGLARRLGATEPAAPVASLEPRFRYNQDFRSLYAMVPGVIALLLVFIPAILMALGVVREKELGTITNLMSRRPGARNSCSASSCPTWRSACSTSSCWSRPR